MQSDVVEKLEKALSDVKEFEASFTVREEDRGAIMAAMAEVNSENAVVARGVRAQTDRFKKILESRDEREVCEDGRS